MTQFPPPLSNEDEQTLARGIQQLIKSGKSPGTLEYCLTSLVMSVMSEAVAYTIHCSKGNVSESEAISVCYETLMKNARRFQPGHNMRFIGFAKVGLRGSINRYFTSLKTVRNATEMASLDAFSYEAQDGISKKYLAEGDDSEDFLAPLEKINMSVTDPDFESVFTRDRWALVEPVMKKCLTPHELMVLTLTFQGINGRELGTLFDVSRSAISATCKTALKKIRCALLRQGRLFNTQ